MSTEIQTDRMGAAGYITIFVVIVYLGFEVYGLQHARERMEPTAVYREFVGARYVAESCEAAPPLQAAFERNFAAVTERALSDLHKQQPDADEDTINAALAALRDAREAEVDDALGDEGCTGKEAWRLLKLYEIRSRLNLRPIAGSE